MRITVVTVCLDSAATIGDTLASVNTQTNPDIEHLVIDGGSTDGTQDTVRAAGRRVARLVSEPDRGLYDAMNKGLALATGDVVGFLNADDTFAAPTVITRIAQAFEDTSIEACYGDVVYVKPAQPAQIIRHWRAGVYHRGQCARGWAPPHPTLYVRRAALVASGGFALHMPVAADFDLALRLFDIQGLPVCYIPEVLVRMRAGGVSNGSLRGILRGHRDMAAALERHGLPAGWGWTLRRLASRIPQIIARG